MPKREYTQNQNIKISRGWFARLVYGRTRAVLLLEEDGFHFGGGKKEYLVPIPELIQPAQVVSGWFWDRFILHRAKRELTFKGFKKGGLNRLAGGVNARLKRHAESLLEAESAPLLTVAAGIEQILSGQRYARESQRRRLVEAAIQVCEIRRHGYWDFYANEAQRQALATASSFVQQSEPLAQQANAVFVNQELARLQIFFDTIESKPLTHAQRKACVINEDHNLVLAGAGTGKTSTMIGRAGYLLASRQAQADELLMLAFANKAKGEMQERQDTRLSPLLQGQTPAIKTFHSLGLEIIGKAERKRPALSRLAEDDNAFHRFIDGHLMEQLQDAAYKNKVVQYFTRYFYPYRNPFDFKSMQEYNDYVRRHELRTLQGEAVKSYEECEVANFLLRHGIRYQYEANYVVDTRTPDYRQYRPDFFLPDHGIYIEHFALDKSGQPPAHFDRQRYLDGIKWKRELHSKHQTCLVETYSYLKREGKLTSTLEKSLQELGVILERTPDETLLAGLREQGKVTDFSKLLAEFLKLFKQSYQTWPSLLEKSERHQDSERLGFLLGLFKPIFEAYQRHLAERHEIDFADMIGRAIEHIEAGTYHSPFTHILVDEFQDISLARARLVQALLKQRPEAVLFAVGDDWQSIYRFTGSDIGLTKHFGKCFGATAISALDLTFRFNNQIGEVSSRFVLKNPEQVKKSIGSLAHLHEPAISLVRTQDKQRGLFLALDAIKQRTRPMAGRRTSVLVLARYHFVLEELKAPKTSQALQAAYPEFDIDMMTVHAAKGKEADYVITLGLEKGKSGFPSEKENDALLEFLLPPREAFLYAEERRLFYVALTRARHRAYLVYNPLVASRFVKELIKGEYPVCQDEFDETLVDAPLEDVPCPLCKEGSLIPKQARNGSKFIGCNHFPYCKYTERPCPRCNSLMRREGRFKVCTQVRCGEMQPVCPKCGAVMVRRDGAYGPFWGCLNYTRNTDFACTHTEKHVQFPTRTNPSTQGKTTIWT